MRPLILTIAIVLSQTLPATAQDFVLPTLTFPEPGTFCAPMQICPPEVTRGN